MKKSTTLMTSASVGAMLITGLYAAPVFAQDGDDDTIVITAQRREQNIEDVPVAVSAFTPDSLEDLQVKDAVDLVDIIPNLQGGNNTALGSATMYFLRGQGQDESFATFDPAVGTYVDEVFVSRQNANNLSFFDLERIEVLRGPQGTLFGKNTSGGAVNIVMRRPGEEAGGYAEVGYGKFNRMMARASVDAPLGDNAKGLISAFYVEDDGWLKNTTTGDDENDKLGWGVRGALDLDLSETFNWYITADYVSDSQTNITGVLDGDDVISTSILPYGLEAAYPGQSSKSDYGNNSKAFNITSNMAWEMATGTLNLILGSRNLDQDFLVNFPLPAFGAFKPDSPDDVFVIDNVGEHDQLSAELKWTAQYMDGALDLVAGLFYLEEDNETDVHALFAGPGRDRVITNTAESLAAYVQGDFALSDQLTATIGLRYTDQTKNFDIADNRPGGTLNSSEMDALGIPRELNDEELTPRLALTYDVNDDVMVYASATRGFRSGGWNARVNTPNRLTPFKSETIWSYEIGTRASLSDTLDVYATLFRSELDDLQINVATGAGTFDIGNTGGMENTGLEVETFFRPTDNFSLYAAIGLQNAEYKPDESEFAVCPAGGPNPGLGAFTATCEVADVKRSPDWTFAVGGTYDIQLDGYILQPRASFSAAPDHITTSRGRGPAGDYQLYNLGVELTPDSNAWSAVIECNNCGNERYVTATFGAGDSYYNTPGRWEARLKYNFGGRR